MSLLGCRFVKWDHEKKAVTSVSAEFVWNGTQMQATCDDDMRKWQVYWTGVPMLTFSSKVVGNSIEMTATYPVAEQHSESCPAEVCKCGFWNLHDLRAAGSVMRDEIDDGVMILTESNGKIVLHDNGFRSEYCKPVAVVYPFTYKMETKWFMSEDVYRTVGRYDAGLPIEGNSVWVKKVRVRAMYGHTQSYESIMVSLKLRIPAIAPSEATDMLRNSRMENNLL